jgi:hypothetical protein
MPGWQRSIDNTNIGQRQAKKGAFTELKASTDPTDEHGVGDRGYYSDLVAENSTEEIWYSSGGEIVETTKTQTLTNKTLTSPAITGGTNETSRINTPKINEDVALSGTSTELNDAVSKKHANTLDHTQNTDTGTSETSFKINSGGHEADIQTGRLTGDRDFEFPDIDGLIVIGNITANNSFECIAYI